MDNLVADLRYAARVLRKSPLFTLITVSTLALGIGANTAVFSTADAVLIRSLPYDDPDRVVMVWEDATFAGFPRNTPAPGNFADWKARNRVFTDMAATSGASRNLTGDGPPEQILGRAVTPNFFAVLGVKAAVGRTFLEEDARTRAPLVVISHALWQRRYNGDPEITGRSILMDGAKRTVIGVMPRGFAFRNRDVDFWITPLTNTPADAETRNSHFLNVVARLRPEVSIAAASDDMKRVAGELAQEFPASNARVGAVVVPIRTDVLGDTRLELLVLSGAAACVLLIACANLAGLLLARALSRRGEMAVRSAIGATSRRLVRQLLVESLLLSLAGGALGLALAPIGMRMLRALVPTGLIATDVSRLDPRLLGFTIAVSIAAGLLFGIAPAVHVARSSINDALKQTARAVGRTNQIARDGLVVLQVAVALALLAGAGLMLRTLANLHAIDVGFRADRVLTIRTTLPRDKYREPLTRLAFYDRVVDGVQAVPGVTAAAYGSTLPFQSQGNTTSYRIEGRERAADDPTDATLRVGTNSYLQTLGAQLLEGRFFENGDRQGAPAVVIVNETFARRYWPAESAIGRRIAFGAPDAPWRTIVGVVKDVRERGFELAMKPGLYAPFAQSLDTWALPEQLIVRTAGEPTAVAATVRKLIGDVDPDQPIGVVRTLDDVVDLTIADRHQQTVLLGAFSALALLVATLGLYGVLSFAVTERTREIGVRMALGATAASVTRLVIKRGLGLTTIGVVAGLALALVGTRSMNAILYAVPASDPMTFAAVVALLSAVALIACSFPALRAARVDPIRVLRQE